MIYDDTDAAGVDDVDDDVDDDADLDDDVDGSNEGDGGDGDGGKKKKDDGKSIFERDAIKEKKYNNMWTVIKKFGAMQGPSNWRKLIGTAKEPGVLDCSVTMMVVGTFLSALQGVIGAYKMQGKLTSLLITEVKLVTEDYQC